LLRKGVFFVAFEFTEEKEAYFGINIEYFNTIVFFGGYEMRVKITLACTECKQRNYDKMKNKKNDPDRLEMNKYCRFCRKHTLHKETK